MAKNVTLLGADYPDVPAVDLPKTGGGTARFVDPGEIKQPYVIKHFEASATIAAETSGTGSIPITKPSGYSYLSAFIDTTPNASWVYASVYGHSSNSVSYGYRNQYYDSLSGKFGITVIFEAT